MKIHEAITVDLVMYAVERQRSSLDNPGFCLNCGEEEFDCEPDAEERPCAHCGEETVYGAEEILIMMVP